MNKSKGKGKFNKNKESRKAHNQIERKGKVSTVTLQKEVDNVKKQIKSIERVEELKHIDTLQGTASIPASGGALQGLITCLNTSVTGDLASGNREGSEIRCTSVQIRGHLITGNTSVTDFPTEFRMILFWDRQPNEANPTLYTSGTGSGSMGLLDNSVVTPIVHAPFNHEAMGRYKVLYDKLVLLNSTGGTTNMPIAYTINIKKKINRVTKYKAGAGGGTVADIVSNALWFVVFNSAGNDDSTALWGARVYYKDD